MAAAISPANTEDTTSIPGKTIRLRIQRQDRPDAEPYWDEFQVPYHPGMNVISCLMEIQRNPVNSKGQRINPVVWDSNCLEEVCGSCSVVINSRVRQACTALVDNLEEPIEVKAMRTFPIVRDLIVDRTRMFEALKRVHAWVTLDGTHDLGPGPKMSSDVQEERYPLSTCMTCGCCLEACPNVHQASPFMGAFAINQVRLFNEHPTGAMHADDRLEALTQEGGIAWCGNNQNCVKVCPKEIPLTDSIASQWGATARYSFRKLFRS
ncbi:MAG: succinate dehydrogenase iron-sulfur subunit [Chloroflexota bacterium]